MGAKSAGQKRPTGYVSPQIRRGGKRSKDLCEIFGVPTIPDFVAKKILDESDADLDPEMEHAADQRISLAMAELRERRLDEAGVLRGAAAERFEEQLRRGRRGEDFEDDDD